MKENTLSYSNKFLLINELFDASEASDPSSYTFDRIHINRDENFDHKRSFLNELEEKQIISLSIDPDKDYIEFSLIDSDKLAEQYRKAYIGKLHEGEPAVVIYHPYRGLCSINGHNFKLKGRNKKIFTLLFNNANRMLDKGVVWRVAGRRGIPRDENDTIIFNSYITNLRRALGGISPNQLRLNQTVELWAFTYLTDENDLISEKISTI